jgi:hypothetical protein
MYRLVPQDAPAYGLVVYAGMTLVSALLYECVEEPARRFVLRIWPAHGATRAPAARPARAASAWALVAVVVGVALVQAVAWAGSRVEAHRGLPTVHEARRVAEALPDRIVALPADRLLTKATPDGSRHRIPIPESWMIGAGHDRRAPPSLLVFADGEPVPFERRAEDLEPSLAGAHYRGPRTTYVELLLPAGVQPSHVTLVRHDPALALWLLAGRLASSPGLLAAIACVAAAAAVAGRALHLSSRPSLRAAGSAALGAGLLFFVSGIHEQGWAPLVIGAELVALYAVARVRPAPAPA